MKKNGNFINYKITLIKMIVHYVLELIHGFKSSFGILSQDRYSDFCKLGKMNTSSVIRVRLSLLSHSTRDNVTFFRADNWEGVNVVGFSYQNLKTIGNDLVKFVKSNQYNFNVQYVSIAVHRLKPRDAVTQTT